MNIPDITNNILRLNSSYEYQVKLTNALHRFKSKEDFKSKLLNYLSKNSLLNKEIEEYIESLDLVNMVKSKHGSRGKGIPANKGITTLKRKRKRTRRHELELEYEGRSNLDDISFGF